MAKDMPLTHSIPVLITLDYITRILENRPDVADEFLFRISGQPGSEDTSHPASNLRFRILKSIANNKSGLKETVEKAYLVRAYNMHKQGISGRVIVREDNRPSVWLYASGVKK